ncbi:MAG: hypothetical protein ACYCTW_05825 [Sulfuricella sp.]
MFKVAWLAFLAAGFATVSSIAVGDEQTQKHEQTRQQIQGPFFGPQLLSEEEQVTYRARIRNAKTPEEAEVIREEHYQLMRARAKEKGVALPEKRPPVGGGLGSIFGPQLMTEEERAAYRAKIRSAKTKEAFEKIRTEHHEEMQARAKENGVIPPETPPSKEGGGGGIMGAIFGPQLMTEEEQVAYRAKLRGAKSQEEREMIRAEHHRQLQSRAKEKGVALP